jgi:hypothetical protein
MSEFIIGLLTGCVVGVTLAAFACKHILSDKFEEGRMAGLADSDRLKAATYLNAYQVGLNDGVNKSAKCYPPLPT